MDFPLPVHREVVHDLVEPGLRVLRGVELAKGEDESILDDISGVLHGQSLLPNRPPDQGQEELAVKSLKLWSVPLWAGGRRPSAGLPRRLSHRSPSLCLKMWSL